MRRWTWALTAGAVVAAVLVSGCGNLKKEPFLTEYNDYKAANEQRFTTVESAIQDADTRIGSLEQTTTSLKDEIQDAKEEAMAAAEQGDADTLASATQSAEEKDSALRDQLLAAINDAKAAAIEDAAANDAEVKEDLISTFEAARAQVMENLDSLSSKSAGQLEGVRQDISDTLMKAIPTKVATVYFSSGSAKLTQLAMSELDKALEQIQDNPNALVKVIGYADSRPILSGKYLTNLQLSEARAKSVADYLTGKGVQNDIEVSGRGHFETVGLQSTKEGQDESRRVEVLIKLK